MGWTIRHIYIYIYIYKVHICVYTHMRQFVYCCCFCDTCMQLQSRDRMMMNSVNEINYAHQQDRRHMIYKNKQKLKKTIKKKAKSLQDGEITPMNLLGLLFLSFFKIFFL
uniref:Uncharacterized protein n=1 Tax=Octopus bimaculoides TaxID=37653 RepID=A0A0L8GDW3_OCTBM